MLPTDAIKAGLGVTGITKAPSIYPAFNLIDGMQRARYRIKQPDVAFTGRSRVHLFKSKVSPVGTKNAQRHRQLLVTVVLHQI
jgi:hypothetical protein